MRLQISEPSARVATRRVSAVIASCALLLAAACHDEPKPPRPLTLDNAWPNQDGRSWTYEITSAQWSTLAIAPLPPEVIFATREAVPPAPGLAEVPALLDRAFTGTPIATDEGVYTLQFQGTRTTMSGAQGQNLVATLDGAPLPTKSDADRGFGDSARDPSGAGVPDVLLARIAAARPDLRARIQAQFDIDRLDEVDPLPLFLSDGVWEKNDSWIGRYGDLDRSLSWLYLDDDLDLGHEFTLQLIPELADDVFLHGRLNARVTAETNAGTYREALDVVYQIDFGVSLVTDITGGPLGYARMFDLARVVYAAGVGPVFSEEHRFYMMTEQSQIGPWGTVELPLQSTGIVR